MRRTSGNGLTERYDSSFKAGSQAPSVSKKLEDQVGAIADFVHHYNSCLRA
jgi:hypothetical protein